MRPVLGASSPSAARCSPPRASLLLLAAPALSPAAWPGCSPADQAEVPGHARALARAHRRLGRGARRQRAHRPLADHRLGAARLGLALWWSLALLTAALAIAAPAASVGLLPPVLVAAALLALARVMSQRTCPDGQAP
jgi:hypothetical protein